MDNYNGKTVYITGGSSGIGLSAAKMLAAAGAHVIIFARTKARLAAALKEIQACRRSEGQRFSAMPLDVSDHKKVMKVMAEAVKKFGAPEVLINSAGRAYPNYFEKISYDQFDETMKIHVYGIWNVISALFPFMKARGGLIVNVSSLAGFLGVFGYSDYAASKFGIIGLSEALRQEFKRYHIKVQVLCPADTDTPGFEVENRTKPPETVAVSGNAKIYQPDEVARVLLKDMSKRKFLIIVGFDGKLGRVLKGIAPGLVEWIFDRDIRKAQEKKG